MEKNIGFSARVFRYFKIKLIGKVAFVLYVREFAWRKEGKTLHQKRNRFDARRTEEEAKHKTSVS